MSRAQQVSRLVIKINNAIPDETNKLIVLMALNKLEIRILELMYDNTPKKTNRTGNASRNAELVK